MLVLGMMISSTAAANAASTKYQLWGVDSCYVGMKNVTLTVGYYNEDTKKSVNGTIKSVTVTSGKDKAVVNHTKGSTWYSLDLKKTGKIKLKVIYKKKSGTKKYTLYKTVTIRKYPNMIKSLKVNGNSINITKARRYGYTVRKYKGTQPKIKLIPAKGWKYYYVQAYRFSDKESSDSRLKFKTIKEGRAIAFDKKYDGMTVDIYLMEEETSRMIIYTVYFTRD
jgi:hypothetical protein